VAHVHLAVAGEEAHQIARIVRAGGPLRRRAVSYERGTPVAEKEDCFL